MTGDHEKMLEDTYILDFERSMRVRVRRNALLANWLAGRTGRNDLAAMADEVLALGQAEAGDDALCEKLASRLADAGIALDVSELRSVARSLIAEATEQLAAEDGAGPRP